MTEAAITCVARIERREAGTSGELSQTAARSATSPTISHFGTLRPERPTQLMD